MKRFHLHWRGIGADPGFDWYLCLSCFAAALMIVAIIDALLYLDLMRAEHSQAVDSPASVLNRADLEAAADKAAAKDAAPHSIPQSVLRDPSL